MKIVAISDLHGALPDTPDCDVLVVAGDVCPVIDHSPERQWRWLRREFSQWLERQPAERVIGIAGNHDFALQQDESLGYELPWTYLRDETVTLGGPGGPRVHGSPWTPPFLHWAFMLEEPELAKVHELIPDNVDMLVTHGPAHGVADVSAGTRQSVGSRSLRDRIDRLDRLRLHVFGHIHEERGRGERNGYEWANVSFVDLAYKPYSFARPWEEFIL